jgi:hypothetical protein
MEAPRSRSTRRSSRTRTWPRPRLHRRRHRAARHPAALIDALEMLAKTSATRTRRRSTATSRCSSKVLIANRGEIALRDHPRVPRAGHRSVAVYSDADAGAARREADEAVRISAPAPARELPRTATKPHRGAAKAVGADAIHPGYGFLSEREWFARPVRDAARLHRPPADAIAAMGSKTESRKLMIGPASRSCPAPRSRCVTRRSLAADRGASFGYPVLLKAAAGGGGKGMRVVREAGEIEAALAAAQREAKNAFGDDAVYVEKYIEGPRHVEIQVLADQHGRCIAPRRARVLDPAPPPEDDRGGAVGRGRRGPPQAAWATRAQGARQAAGYVNAGTCRVPGRRRPTSTSSR